MAEKVNLQQQIQQYRQANPKLAKLSDKQILSIMVKNGKITLTEAQKKSIFADDAASDDNMGLKLERTGVKQKPEKTIYLQSGRKVVYSKLADGRTVMKYFGSDGTQLNPDYFKKVEGEISISADGDTYTVTKDGKKSKPIKAKDPTQGAIDQNLARLNNEEKRLNKTKNEQGFIGSGWDLVKNSTGLGDGSDKAQKQIEAERNLLNQIKTGKVSKSYFKEVTGLDYSKENLEKFKRGELSQATAKIDGYAEGQDMAVDVAGDLVSGVAAVGIYTAAVAAAPVTGGASIALGVAVATASGALIKSGVKALDTVGTDREYTLKDFGHDAVTGAFSGALAPVTAGLGGAVGKTVATKLGVQAVKQVGKEVAEEAAKGGVKQTLKTALTNPAGYEYVGGNVAKRSTAWVAEAATDGALGGAIDGGFREGVDQIEKGEDINLGDIASAAVEGGIGGAIFSPVVGGGFKLAGKGAQKAGESLKSRQYLEYRNLKSALTTKSQTNANLNYFCKQYVESGGKHDDNFIIINKPFIQDLARYENACKLLLCFQKAGFTNNSIKNSRNYNECHKYIIELYEKFYSGKITDNNLNSILECIDKLVNKNNVDVESTKLLRYVELLSRHVPIDNISDFTRNFVSKLKPQNIYNMTSEDYFNNIELYLMQMEIDDKACTVEVLKNIFKTYITDMKNIKYEKVSDRERFDIEYLINNDKAMFHAFLEIIDKNEKKSTESLLEYFKRICNIRLKNDKMNKQNLLKERNAILKKGYSDVDDYTTINLTDEDLAKYNKNPKQYYIRVANNSGVLGANPMATEVYVPYTFDANVERYTFEKHFERYNGKKSGLNSGYQFPPVYRMLDPVNMTIADFSEKYFGKIGESYSPRAYQCCSIKLESCAGEMGINPIRFPVVMEIHPKCETSRAFCVGGKGGDEVRYPANTNFKIIDKYIDIYEESSGVRQPVVYILMQEF